MSGVIMLHFLKIGEKSFKSTNTILWPSKNSESFSSHARRSSFAISYMYNMYVIQR